MSTQVENELRELRKYLNLMLRRDDRLHSEGDEHIKFHQKPEMRGVHLILAFGRYLATQRAQKFPEILSDIHYCALNAVNPEGRERRECDEIIALCKAFHIKPNNPKGAGNGTRTPHRPRQRARHRKHKPG